MSPTRCAVLGSPIAHSVSPALHTAAYRTLGLTDWQYERHQVDADSLAGFVDQLGPQWRGLSLTMPLKQAALELGQVDPAAALVGAGNTLLLPERTVHNTDIVGLVRALQYAGVERVGTVTLLGSGATSRSALASVAELGANKIVVVARRPHRTEPLQRIAAELGIGVQVLGWAEVLTDPTLLGEVDLTISGVVAGAADPLAAVLAERSGAVFDVIYDPWPTPLAQAAQRAGRTVCHGLDLLVHQAVAQVELMTGHSVDPAVLMSAGRSALGLSTDL